MTSEARTPGVSPAKLADQALDDIADECGHCGWSGDCPAPHRACRQCASEILAKLVRDAQVEALESVAKGCAMCREGHELHPPGDGKSRWWHVNPRAAEVYHEEPWDYCRRPEVHEALARLRQSASAPDER